MKLKTKLFRTRNSDDVKLRNSSSDNLCDLPLPLNTLPKLDTSERVVSGFVDSNFGASKLEQTYPAKIANHFLANSKSITLTMGLVIGLLGSLWLLWDNSSKEQSLRKYTSSAELLEFDNRFITAAEQWHHAIKIAESMSGKSKLLGDLHVRAANAEEQASEDDTISSSTPLNFGSIAPSQDEEKIFFAPNQKPYQEAEIKDLRDALAIYEKIPNTNADQLGIIDRLKPLLEKEVDEFELQPTFNPFFVHAQKKVRWPTAEPEREEALRDMLAKKPGLGLSSFKNYLRETRNSSRLLNPIIDFAVSLRSDEQSVHSDLVQVFYELIYYHQLDPQNLLVANYWMDHSLHVLGRKPFALQSKLEFGDTNFKAKNYHAAIVDYHRYIGNKSDETVRQKLCRALELCRQQDLSNHDPALEYTTLLNKAKKLDLRVYGIDNKRTQDDICRLGVAYAASNQFEAAERELRLAKPDYNLNGRMNIFNLADLFAKDGRPYMALDCYRRGKNLEAKQPKITPTPEIWARMALVDICAGQMRHCRQYIALADKERPYDIFGSNTSGTIHQPIME